MLSLIVAAAATVAGAPAVPSDQSRFDAATRAWEERRCAEAVQAFDTLTNSVAARRNPTVAAAIAVRRGSCLAELGRTEEAEASIRSGIDTLAAASGTFTDEVGAAYTLLGQLAAQRLDYDAGIAAAHRALSLSNGPARVLPLLLLATLHRFDGDDAAVRYAMEALQLTEARPDVSKQDIANVQVIASRALIAANRIDEADTLLKKALTNNGGLTTRTTLDDAAARYDLAQVALIKKRMGDARRYLAYAGAGRRGESPFAQAMRIDVPQCGEVPGMTPESYAVVELSLGDDGTIIRAEPVYAQGGRDVALAFARAVHGWSWTPEAARAIPAFFRLVTRVELRCTRASGGVDVGQPLAAATVAWLEQRGVAAPVGGVRDADLIARWRAVATGNDAAALDANLQLAQSVLSSATDGATAAARAARLAATLEAPQTVRTQAALVAITGNGLFSRTRQRDPGRQDTELRALLARPEVAAEPVGAATLRLTIAHLYRTDRNGVAADAAQLIAAVADASDLPERHPLRVHALLAQANAAAARGDLPAAAAAFARTGLSEQQCALIGPTPVMASSGGSSALYPLALLAMGFEGWTRIEYDIAADGRTAGQRTLIASPPFLFDDAAKTIIGKTRYVRSYRPETSVACTANQQSIRFSMGSD